MPAPLPGNEHLTQKHSASDDHSENSSLLIGWSLGCELLGPGAGSPLAGRTSKSSVALACKGESCRGLEAVIGAVDC
jgi:hypothetical protein